MCIRDRLYQGGATSSKVRQAVINKQKALDDVEIARRQTELDTQRAYLNLSTSIAQIKALEPVSYTHLDVYKRQVSNCDYIV